MIKRISKRWLVINILCLLLFVGIFLFVQVDFIRQWRVFVVVVGLISIAQLIFDYEIYRKAKLAWSEPKSFTRLRRKADLLSQFRQTSWSRISVLLLIVFIPLQLILPRWYYLPVILSFGISFAVLLLFINYYLQKATIVMDENGIRLGGSDARLRKYLYSKITSIELVPNLLGSYSLAWCYNGKEIMRGISQDIETSQIKTLIENNSKLQLIMNEALTSGSTADQG